MRFMLFPIHQVTMSTLSENTHRARAAYCIPGGRPLRSSVCRKQLTARQVLDRNRTSHCSNTPREHRQCRAEQAQQRLLLTLSYTAMQSPQPPAQVGHACAAVTSLSSRSRRAASLSAPSPLLPPLAGAATCAAAATPPFVPGLLTWGALAPSACAHSDAIHCCL